MSTMTSPAESILSDLHLVAHERRVRQSDAPLGARVQALKLFQQRRFADTYADLSATPRYAAATKFFLEELYGPRDFTQRDAQFARVVPALVRLFPDDIVRTVATLATLHSLSEVLDTAMAHHLPAETVSEETYRAAWCATARPEDRTRQIELMMSVGLSMDRWTRKPLLRQSLRLMRGPAKAAGLEDLQRFLEAGFETFRNLRGAAEFLSIIERRERDIATDLFSMPPLDSTARTSG